MRSGDAGRPRPASPLSFAYHNTRVEVTRLPQAWRVKIGGREAQARTLVSAFEALLDQPLGDSEMKVVLAALAEDRAPR
jgi:hypothetical protein